MAFNGSWLVKVGDYPIPLSMMSYGSYKASRNVQDLDSYRDADGILHRNALPHVAFKVEFETIYMTLSSFRTLIDNIKDNILDNVANDVNLTYYDPWSDSYKSGHFYLPGTLEFPLLNKEICDQTRIAFIEY